MTRRKTQEEAIQKCKRVAHETRSEIKRWNVKKKKKKQGIIKEKESKRRTEKHNYGPKGNKKKQRRKQKKEREKITKDGLWKSVSQMEKESNS